MEIFFDYTNMDMARKSAWTVRECVKNHPFESNVFQSRARKILKFKGK
jgi:hypothetical protein